MDLERIRREEETIFVMGNNMLEAMVEFKYMGE